MPTPSDPKLKTDAAPGTATPPPKPSEAIPPSSPAATFFSEVLGIETKPADKPKPDAPEKKPAAKKKVAAPPPPAAAVIDEEKLGQSIARGLAEHTAKTAAEPPPPAPAVPAADDRRTLVLKRMEELGGEKYKGLAERFKANEQKLKQRAVDWEKANPGESFADRLEAYEDDPEADPDFAEEAKFAASLEAESDYDEDDFRKAEVALMKDEIRADVKKEVEGELGGRISEIERERQRRDKQQEINSVAYAAGNECLTLLGDEFAAAVKEEGGIDADAMLAIKQADPVKHDIGVAAMTAAEQGAAIIHMLSTGLEKMDPKNVAHVQLSEFARRQEQAMLQRPPEKLVNEEGQTFCTKDEYAKMTPAQRKQHFIFTADDLKALWVADVTKRAKADLQAEDEKFTARARARGLITDSGQPVVQPLQRPVPPERSRLPNPNDLGLRRTPKPESPSFTPSPKLATPKPAGKGGPQNPASAFIADVFA